MRSVTGTCASGNSATIEVRTLAAPATTANPADGVDCDEFRASWTEVPGAEYRVDVALDNAFASPVAGYTDVTVAVGTFELDVVGLTAGTEYFYRVRAIDPVCDLSADSNPISVTTLGTPGTSPQQCSSQQFGFGTGFTLNWDAVTGVANYRVEASDDGFANIASQIVPAATYFYFQ